MLSAGNKLKSSSRHACLDRIQVWYVAYLNNYYIPELIPIPLYFTIRGNRAVNL